MSHGNLERWLWLYISGIQNEPRLIWCLEDPGAATSISFYLLLNSTPLCSSLGSGEAGGLVSHTWCYGSGRCYSLCFLVWFFFVSFAKYFSHIFKVVWIRGKTQVRQLITSLYFKHPFCFIDSFLLLQRDIMTNAYLIEDRVCWGLWFQRASPSCQGVWQHTGRNDSVVGER